MNNLHKTLLCISLSVFLLAGCGEQPAEEPVDSRGTSSATQLPTEENDILEEGELPSLTLPQQTQPVTEGIEATQPTVSTEGSQESDTTEPAETSPSEVPTVPSEPSESEPPVTVQPTVPPETTQPTEPPETTPPVTTEPTEPTKLDEDELPPIPVF